ncbi:MAG: HRDC domain-containing protein [Bacteroidia bacterium]|nr:HRDC domain-containing protein [Bacteroidia bacterium]
METKTFYYNMNIKPVAVAVFKTITLLKRNYGINYITRIVKGDNRFEWKEEIHTQLETFGVLRNFPDYKIKNIINWLMMNHYLCTTNLEYGTLGLSEKAHQTMETEDALWVSNWELSMHTERRITLDSLKALRKSLSVSEKKPVFQVFTDYTLQMLLNTMPETMTDLKSIQGMNEGLCDKYGHLILRTITNAKKQAEMEIREKRIEKVKGVDYQSVKELINEEKKIERVIEKTGFSKDRILKIMKDLHETGEMDVKPFIEKNIKPKDLHKATEFFRQTNNPKLKTAYETLGLDYETLRMCRLYISDVKSDIVAIA